MNQEKNINYCKFSGTLAKKPVLFGNEKKYVYITIICKRDYQNNNEKNNFDYINFKLWKNPEKVIEELKENQYIEIEAHYNTGSYINDKGNKTYTNDLIIDKINYSLELEQDKKSIKESNELER